MLIIYPFYNGYHPVVTLYTKSHQNSLKLIMAIKLDNITIEYLVVQRTFAMKLPSLIVQFFLLNLHVSDLINIVKQIRDFEKNYQMK